MRYVSIFSGVEAATLAWEPLGWEPLAFCEIDDFPSAVLAEHWPNVPNLGDITKVDWKKEIHGAVDLVVGGSPCFPAGTLVLREDGYVPIEEIKVGDMVVSHTGKLRKVLATGSKIADTVILKGAGTDEIECTPNHPFYATEKEKTWVKEERQYRMIPTGEFSWTKADEMKGKYWLNVCEVDGGGIPHFSGAEKGQRGKGYIDDLEFGYDFFYFVGRWLGDGWANAHERKDRVDSQMKRVYVCCSFDEADALEARLKRAGIHFGRTHERTTDRFVASSTQLYDWLTDNFGVHADGKKIPTWCLGIDADLKRAIFEGYMDSDGCVYNGKSSSTSINKALCLGIKAIAGSLGYSTCLVKSTPNRVAYIEGRKVNERPQFRQQYESSPRSSFFVDKGWCGLVRNVLPGRKNVRVYNLEVEVDNSYAADGIAVHNCQSFSIAGKREGLKGASGLMFEYIRCVQELMPRWFLWENVKGALSCERGAAFGQLLREMDALGYGLAWRVLDAQFFGVAQRRERLFLVGHLGDARACEVLFEPESMCWDTPSSREKRQAIAAASGRSVAQGGDAGCLNPADPQSKRIYTPESCAPTLSSGTTEGMNIQPSVFSIAGNIIGRKPENGGNGNGFQEPGEPMCTLTTIDRPAVAFKYHQGSKAGGIGAAVEQSPTLTADYHNPAVMYEESETCTAGLSETGQANQGGGKGPLIQDELSGTLSTVNNQSLVCMTDTQKNTSVDDEIAGTISAHTSKDQPVVAFKNNQGATSGIGTDESEPIEGYHNLNDNTTAESGINSVVRRLTPLECERLQGFPDNHTRIPWKGKPAEECPDSLRYKACGNSMAVPVMRWLGERIEAVDRL